MKIRYFFIVGAITSGLSLSLEASEHVVNQQQNPVISPYTNSEEDLNLFEPVVGTFNLSSKLVTYKNNTVLYGGVNELYKQGKNLLYAVAEFLHSIIMLCIQALFTVHNSSA
ncbi:hypothetical protein [Bartonella heixiaziensis]|uniref:hypothetical protein n=1 Tax=Bartonella heixiaziensis TaxID=1461000 RepID=UPI003D1A93DB